MPLSLSSQTWVNAHGIALGIAQRKLASKILIFLELTKSWYPSMQFHKPKTHFSTDSVNSPSLPVFSIFNGLPVLASGNRIFILSPYVPLVSTVNLSTSVVSSVSKIAFEYLCFLFSILITITLFRPFLCFSPILRRAVFPCLGFPSPSSLLFSISFFKDRSDHTILWLKNLWWVHIMLRDKV